MAWRMVRQPNGLLARFSEVVDNFTHVNLTAVEAMELCAGAMNAENAAQKVQRGIDSDSRWAEAIDIIRRAHGDGEVLKLELMIREDEQREKFPAVDIRVIGVRICDNCGDNSGESIPLHSEYGDGKHYSYLCINCFSSLGLKF